MPYQGIESAHVFQCKFDTKPTCEGKCRGGLWACYQDAKSKCWSSAVVGWKGPLTNHLPPLPYLTGLYGKGAQVQVACERALR